MANQYLPFAVGTSPNTMTYSAYAALPAVGTGFVSGVASSEQFNTLMRQVSVPTAGLAQWASDTAGVNANDDGSTTNFKALLDSAFSAKLSPYLLKSGGMMTGDLYLRSAEGLNAWIGGTGDGASYSTYNFAIQGWYGLGLIDYSGSVNGYYDFRAGKWDVRGGFFVNGARVWDQTNFNPGNYLPISGGTLTGPLTLPNGAIGLNVGDDARISDRNMSDTAFLEGQQNSDRGYINFSSTPYNALGAINGGPLTWRGSEVIHSSNFGAYATALVNNLFTCSNGNTGWAKYSTGQIEQWGQVYVGDLGSSGISSSFTFPIAFPNACNSVQLTCYDANNIGRAIPAVTSVPSTTGFTFRIDEESILAQNITVYITARGY